MPVPAEISQPVELFGRNSDQYRDPAFNEATVRRQFIDPLFIALGWDVNNTQGFAMRPQDPHEKAALQRRIEMTDRQIDALVYEVYELTAEEIKVVEGATNRNG
jgi:hypothetical protein